MIKSVFALRVGMQRELSIWRLASIAGLLAILIEAAAGGSAYAFFHNQSSSTGAGHLDEFTLDSDDFTRRYLLFVPTSYRKGTAVPLVLVFHGGGGSAEGMAKTSRMHEVAEKNGFVVAYLNGLGRGGRSERASWNAESIARVGWSERNGIDDVGFTADVIHDISTRLSIDDKRIYAAGMSKGAMMAYYAACQMPDKFAAIAAVAGTLSAADCPAKNPVAILHIHGKNDENVPWRGGQGAYTGRRAEWPPVERGLGYWREINQCAASQTVTHKGRDTKCTAWQSCANDAVVEVCLVEGGGHAWPGSKAKQRQVRRNVYVSPHFQASKFIWSFFAKHKR